MCSSKTWEVITDVLYGMMTQVGKFVKFFLYQENISAPSLVHDNMLFPSEGYYVISSKE
jgi:hypothetical protein